MATSAVVNCLGGVRPHTIRYEPNMWTHTFSNFSIDEQVQGEYAEEIEALKQEVRSMLTAATTCKEQLILIDTLERLGLSYHFETEIEQKLKEIILHINREEDASGGDCDLYTTSLGFRVIRQHQYHISCGVFEKYLDKDGKFEESLSSDTEGILSLYEAAHVRFRDETLLQEAARFSRHHLKGMEEVLESPLREKVQRALQHPLHRDIPIFYAHFFISNIYQKDDSRNELLLKLAKSNFMFLQNLYKEELSQLSRWWNKFDLKSKLPYARDRLVEAYIWGVGYHYEPRYAYVRRGLVIGIQIIAIMDDTYDNYATVDEAQLFTEMFERWSMDGIDGVPDYLKIAYHFVVSAFEDYERDAGKLGKQFAAPYFKQTIQQLARAYNQELKWVMGTQSMPSFQDYAKNSEITSCIYIMSASVFHGLESVTQETIDWLKNEPNFAVSTGMIGRYWDDIGSHERESRGGKMLTAVGCYMKQYGVSKKEAVRKFREQVEDLWKDVNKGYTAMTCMPRETAVLFLNYARMCDASYTENNDDGYTDPDFSKRKISALFLDPLVF
uniref:Tau-cadinol synthase n=1 Tax=Lavandula angustifolia TaxID=39329 RepID=CADS_LAVAN|nr:RecName: Full=Tau-cadinol synthase; Short=LaCADS; AltName: Full=(+)-gamma-cadinene synthase; AltName: Full=Gamma-cadinene synthase [Lavandula angustifolia]AGL98418.1 cadinol synthase [Lavandula angustifolia]